MLVAVPSDSPGGLEARISNHFGHCDFFTMVQVEKQQVESVTVIPNGAHEGGQCTAPVTLLKQQGAEALVAGGMGQRPLSGFQQVGISVYFKEGAETVRDAIDLLIAGKQSQPGALLRTLLAQHLPRKLVAELQELFWQETAETPVGELSNEAIKTVARQLRGWVVRPAATEGYRTAEVTLGGVDTDELSSRTMEARKVPGLYFIGEVVDVTGHLGGFNFQWAWSSGYAAGNAA